MVKTYHISQHALEIDLQVMNNKDIYCKECSNKETPWFDENSDCWVHTQKDGLIVTCDLQNRKYND